MCGKCYLYYITGCLVIVCMFVCIQISVVINHFHKLIIIYIYIILFFNK